MFLCAYILYSSRVSIWVSFVCNAFGLRCRWRFTFGCEDLRSIKTICLCYYSDNLFNIYLPFHNTLIYESHSLAQKKKKINNMCNVTGKYIFKSDVAIMGTFWMLDLVHSPAFMFYSGAFGSKTPSIFLFFVVSAVYISRNFCESCFNIFKHLSII